jgi:fructokinase
MPTRGLGHSELGHLLVPRLDGDVLPSGCTFHRDCVEGIASGTAIKAALGALHVSDVGENHPVWDRVSHALASLCHALVCATGPMRIAIGGGVVAKQPHLIGRIEPLLRASLNGYLSLPDNLDYIVPPLLGDQAGPLGSIALARSVADVAVMVRS